MYRIIILYSMLCVYFVHDPYENYICAFHTFFLFDFSQYLRMVITTIWEYRKIEILVVGTREGTRGRGSGGAGAGEGGAEEWARGGRGKEEPRDVIEWTIVCTPRNATPNKKNHARTTNTVREPYLGDGEVGGVERPRHEVHLHRRGDLGKEQVELSQGPRYSVLVRRAPLLVERELLLLAVLPS